MAIGTYSLSSLRRDEQWQERNVLPFGSDPSMRWVVSYEVVLTCNEDASFLLHHRWEAFKARNAWLFNSNYNKNGILGELFGFIVCSGPYAESPKDDDRLSLHRFHVQQTFDEQEAISYLKCRLSEVRATGARDLAIKLRPFLNVEELDWDVEFGTANEPREDS